MLNESITKDESVTGIHFFRRLESGGCATADCINRTISRMVRYIFPGRTRASKLRKIYGIGLLVVSFEWWVVSCGLWVVSEGTWCMAHAARYKV